LGNLIAEALKKSLKTRVVTVKKERFVNGNRIQEGMEFDKVMPRLTCNQFDKMEAEIEILYFDNRQKDLSSQ